MYGWLIEQNVCKMLLQNVSNYAFGTFKNDRHIISSLPLGIARIAFERLSITSVKTNVVFNCG